MGNQFPEFPEFGATWILLLDSLFAWAARGYIDFESIRLSYAFDVHIYEFYFRTHFLLNYLIYLILVMFE